jgi:hypothetical protein
MATRAEVLAAYAANPKATLNPDESAINFWMQNGLGNFNTTVDQVRSQNPTLAVQIDRERAAVTGTGTGTGTVTPQNLFPFGEKTDARFVGGGNSGFTSLMPTPVTGQTLPENFAQYQAIPLGAQYNSALSIGGLSPYQAIMAKMKAFENPYLNAGTTSGAYTGGFNPDAYKNIITDKPNASLIIGGNDGAATDGGTGISAVDAAQGFAQGIVGSQADLDAAAAAAADAIATDAAQGFAQGIVGDAASLAAAAAAADAAAADAAQGFSQGIVGDSSTAAAAAAAAAAASDGGAGGGDGGISGYAKGGIVSKSKLRGPNPAGPDVGYGLLQDGEYVIKKSAVDKYGKGLLDMINEGKVPAKKIKSLLF